MVSASFTGSLSALCDVSRRVRKAEQLKGLADLTRLLLSQSSGLSELAYQ